MKVKVITETLSNLQIAERQLEQALSLFLNEEDYVSALTLAGAAEEILGKILSQENYASNSLEELIEDELVLNEVPSGSSDEKKARKEFADIANIFRNKLKHYNTSGSVTLSVDYYAAEILDRAIKNYFSITGNETALMDRFKKEILLE